MPFPNSENVKDFFEEIGPGYYKDRDIRKQGCYILHRRNRNKTYVGQSSFLRKRIREHAGLHNKATREIVKEFGINGKVTVYVIDIKVNMDIKQFIIVLIFLKVYSKIFKFIFLKNKLEQYLFFKLRPTENNLLIARSGGSHQIGLDKTYNSKMVYVYVRYQNKYYLLYVRHSRTSLSILFNKGKGFCADILRYHSGVYQHILFLRENAVEGHIINILEKEKLLEFFQFLNVENIRQSQPIIIKNINTKDISIYPRITNCAKVNESSYSEIVNSISRNRLFRAISKTTFIDKEEYLIQKIRPQIKDKIFICSKLKHYFK